MTMRRTRHKLEPQCDQSCVQGTGQQTMTTPTTKNRHYEQTSSGHSRVFSCCSRECSHPVCENSSADVVDSHTAKTGSFEVLSLHPPSVTVDRGQL